MEREIELRQNGLEAVHSAATIWMRVLGKKKEGTDKEKATPIELFASSLSAHGEDFTPDSPYGQALSKLGVAEQKIGRVQEVFQCKVTDGMLENMQRSLAQMKDYQSARRKLESRRLAYDSALNKVQKAKKEDSRLEEELRAAKAKYDESSDDVQQRMLSIREAEVLLLVILSGLMRQTENLADLGELVALELDYFEDCRNIMQLLRDIWPTK